MNDFRVINKDKAIKRNEFEKKLIRYEKLWIGNFLIDIKKHVERNGTQSLEEVERIFDSQLDFLANKIRTRLSLMEYVSGSLYLGFLGTVIGMISTFFGIAQNTGGPVSPSEISSGIYVALVTSALGLIIKFIGDNINSFVQKRINTGILQIEEQKFLLTADIANLYVR
jgi:biopolymer transport protein ExbB/TolQ